MGLLRLFCRCGLFVFCFFFFKQKTAYEMRISDWSSDVCSSDLQLSQEFQLLYESDRLHGLVGFYYLDARAATSFDVLLGLTGEVLYGLPGLNGYTAGDVRTDTGAVFGEFTFDLTDRPSLDRKRDV